MKDFLQTMLWALAMVGAIKALEWVEIKIETLGMDREYERLTR